MTCPVLMLMTRLSHVWSRLFPISILITLGIATIAARARYTTSIGGVCISNSQYLSLQALDAGFHILALILAFLGGVMCIFHYFLVDARSSPKRVSSQASGYRSISFFHLCFTLIYSTLVLSLLTFSLSTCLSYRVLAAEKNFRMLVIGAHLTIFVMSLLTFATRMTFTPDQNAHAESRYGVFGTGLLVFMVESRLRKNEVNRALYAAIEVKKRFACSSHDTVFFSSYVIFLIVSISTHYLNLFTSPIPLLPSSPYRYARFLERELRAPLSMALLGVRLLKDRLKHTDEEMANTLNDMLSSYVMVSEVHPSSSNHHHKSCHFLTSLTSFTVYHIY